MPYFTNICVIFKGRKSEAMFPSISHSGLKYSYKIKVIIMDFV